MRLLSLLSSNQIESRPMKEQKAMSPVILAYMLCALSGFIVGGLFGIILF